MRIFIKITFLMLIVNLLSGCSKKELIKPDDTFNYRDRDIVVNLQDTTWVYFNNGQYSFGEDDGGKYIRGKWQSHSGVDSMTVAKQETTIYFRQIESVRVVNPNKVIDTTLDILSVGIAVALAGLLILFLVGTRIHHI